MDWMVSANDAQAVPPLRREIMTFLRRHTGTEADLASAELVVGELLSNAVAHGPERARVSLRWDGEHPVLTVADVGRRAGAGQGGPALPADLPADLLADGGRGLYIAEQLSRRLAVQVRASGSVVSATLNLRRRPAEDVATMQQPGPQNQPQAEVAAARPDQLRATS
jgi:anti-sigma regulatory factor (Ser/Thr protein kinase)